MTRLAPFIILLAGLGGCMATARNIHTEAALDQCEELINTEEVLACKARVRNDRWQRDMEDRP